MGNDGISKSRRMGESTVPVTFGMAGVVYTDPRGSGPRDESWLTAAFKPTSWTTRCEWRSDDMTVVTAQHAHETGTTPGAFEFRVPTIDATRGIVFGQFFGPPGRAHGPEATSSAFLSAYARQGVSSLRDLNGMWVAAIWDASSGQAHFARDGIGGQTLYVARLDGRIVFATDQRVFHASGMLCDVDEDAVAQFLHYLYVPAPRALSRGCMAVLPGSILSIGATPRHERFAAPRFVNGPRLSDEADIERQTELQLPLFEEKLLAAVTDCIPPQGRVALALSGGKDSSVLAVALSKLCPDRVLAFTVGQSDGRLNEEHHAALVCNALGLDHQCYVPTDEDLARGIVEFSRVQDQPVGDTAALPYFLGMSRLPEDCTVIIDGTGNDYYFGIPSPAKGMWRYQRRVALQSALGPAWPALLWARDRGPLGTRRLSQFWRRPVEESFVAWEGWDQAELSQLFGRRISFADTYLWQVMRNAAATDWLGLHTEVVCGIWEPHAAYRKAVHFAQALGRSIRFPFTDNRLAQYLQGLPEQLKYRDGINKQILRAYMQRTLPREIVEKPKSGFIFDLDRLFTNAVFAWQDELARAGLLRVLPTWSQDPVDDLLRRHAESLHDPRWQHRLYALCLLATVLGTKDGFDPFAKSAGADPPRVTARPDPATRHAVPR